MNPNMTRAALAVNIMAALGLSAAEAFAIQPADENFSHGRVLAYNASQFAGNNPHEFLSGYAVRYTDPNLASIDAIQQMIAPSVASNNSRFVEYAVYGFADALLALDNFNDDLRGVGADFATVRNPSKSLVTQRLPNRGLAVEVDEEEELLDPDWQQRKVAWLLGIMARSRLRRTVSLFAAAATNVNKTWDTSAGKDPDQDILAELEAASIRPSRIIFGPGAATKRKLAHRAQNTAGGFASAGMSDEEVGGFLGLDTVLTARPKYATGASSASNIVGSLAMLFTAFDGMSRDDFSNLKTFYAPTKAGSRMNVIIRQVGDKRWRIAVDAGNELVAVTSAIGLETMTIS